MFRKISVALFSLFVILFTTCPAYCDNQRSPEESLLRVLNSLIKGKAEFPARFGVINQVKIPDPDIHMKIKNDYMNKVIEGYLKSPIYLDSDGALSKTYITVKKVQIKPDSRRNVLILTVYGGSLCLGGSLTALDNKLVIKKAEFEVAPYCHKDKYNQVSLDLDIRCVYLEFEGAARVINVAIAHVLQEQFLNKRPIKPIFLTQFFRSYTTENGRGYRVQNILTQLAVVVSADGVDFRTKWDVK